MSSEQLIEFLRTTVPASPAIALPTVTDFDEKWGKGFIPPPSSARWSR